MPKLDTSKAAAQAVAEKLSKGKGATTSTTNSSTAATVTTDSRIPGLLTVTPEMLPAMIPAFHPSNYHIVDPLNPPVDLPQATEAQLDKGMKIYEGSVRALKLTGAAFDLTREKFTVVGKHAKAFGAGIQAATEIEKVKGNYLDYLNQQETTKQKAVELDVSQVKTIADTNTSVHSKDEINQKLIQSSIKAEETRLKTIEVQGKLDTFKASLGDYLQVSK